MLDINISKEKTNVSLFTADMIAYGQNPTELKNKNKKTYRY